LPKGIRLDWATLDPRIDQLKAQGWNDTDIARTLGLSRQTFVDHLRRREATGTPTEHPGTPVHPRIPERTWRSPDKQYTQEHLDTPPEAHPPEAHPGTLEEYQEVMKEVRHSVPDMPHLATDEEHPSTPIVHPEVSPPHSSTVHSGVPARQEPSIGTPMVHPAPPTEEDWALWLTIKARWAEVEKLLADQQALLSTPVGTPGQTQKKTYVFDVRYIALIDQYAQAHRLDLKDVIYAMCQKFFDER
jgi:hypothetical protein